VVATGGGLFLGFAQRRWMRETGRVVWLDLSLGVARERVGCGGTRPLWLPQDPLAFRAMFERRRAAYALATLRVSADPGGPEEVAQRVLEALLRISD
jgi:shikimate kinase